MLYFQPYTASLPLDIPVFAGTHADLLIIVFHRWGFFDGRVFGDVVVKKRHLTSFSWWWWCWWRFLWWSCLWCWWWWWKRDVWPSFRRGGGVDGGGGHGVDGVVHENNKNHLSRIITTGHSRLQVDSANLTYSHFQLVL